MICAAFCLVYMRIIPVYTKQRLYESLVVFLDVLIWVVFFSIHLRSSAQMWSVGILQGRDTSIEVGSLTTTICFPDGPCILTMWRSQNDYMNFKSHDSCIVLDWTVNFFAWIIYFIIIMIIVSPIIYPIFHVPKWIWASLGVSVILLGSVPIVWYFTCFKNWFIYISHLQAIQSMHLTPSWYLTLICNFVYGFLLCCFRWRIVSNIDS